MMEKSVWRTSGHGSSPGGERGRNRASFPRGGKLRVISYHFTELVLEIMELGKLSRISSCPQETDEAFLLLDIRKSGSNR